jgi:lysozyme
MAETLGSKLIADLKREEGWRDRPYRDTEGLLTTGFGFLIDESRSIAMPVAVGELWLSLIVEERMDALQNRLPWLSGQPEGVQRALGQMAYQMGVSGVLGFKNMLGALQEGDRVEAAKHALDSAWSRQTPARAKRVAKMIREG